MAPQSAWAGQASAADKETARGLMVRGNELFEKSDYAGALRSYLAAHSLMNVPSTGMAVARAREAMGQLIDAREMAIEVTRMPVQAREPEPIKRARAQAEEMAASLASRIPSVQLDVQGAPAGAAVEVRIDGIALPANLLGLPRKVDPGKHEVTAAAAGFATSRATVEVKEGEQKTLTLVLAAAPFAKPLGTPAARRPVEPARPAEEAPARTRGIPTLSWIGFGVGAAGLAVGGIAGGLTLSKASDAKGQCVGNSCSPSAQSDIDSGKTLGMVSNIGFGVGLAGVAVGVVALLTGPKATPSTAAQVRMMPVLGAGSLGVHGTF